MTDEMQQVIYMNKAMDMVFKSLERPKLEPLAYCDHCGLEFRVSQLNDLEDDQGNVLLLCVRCDTNYEPEGVNEDQLRGDR